MNRALALASLVASLALSPVAHADVALPPTALYVEGQRATLTGPAPHRATFVLRNVTDEPIEAYLFRVIMLDGATRVPLAIDGVEVDGHAAGRTVRVPAGGRIRVTVRFAIPAPLQGRTSYSLDLSLRQGGYGGAESRPAVLARSPSGPQKWAIRTE